MAAVQDVSEAVSERMERRLVAWGVWKSAGGNGAGYPAMSVIHPNWTPPARGLPPRLPPIGASSADEIALNASIAGLSVKMRDALFVRYVKRMSLADQAATLACSESTVLMRISAAKRRLFYELM